MADICVIIPSHNVADFVGAAIQSVLDQTDPPARIFVVDDSSDDSPEVLRGYERSHPERIQVIRVDPCNVSEARNIGLARADRRFVAFLDADDIWLPQKTALQMAMLESDPEAVGAFCGLFTFRHDLDDQGRPVWDVIHDRPGVEQIMVTQMIVSSAMLIRREALADLRFDERTGHAEDTIFSADLALEGPWRCVEQPMLARRGHATQITASPWHTVRNVETRLRWCRERADRLEAAMAARIEQTLRDRLVGFVERRYWTRQLADLRALREAVGRICPRELAASSIAGRRIYPAWLYRLRNWFGHGNA